MAALAAARQDDGGGSLGEARQLAAAVVRQQWQGQKWQCNSATAVVVVAATWLRCGGRGTW
jgi:hypothetical protein